MHFDYMNSIKYFFSRLCKEEKGAVLAVSGGSDSMAMMYLVKHFIFDEMNCNDFIVKIATVDHGLRKESAQEVVFVNNAAQELGFECKVMHWQDGGVGDGNVQSRARSARYKLIEDWCKEMGLSCVLTAHTYNDQAETFLMRAARGSGVNGLSGIRPSVRIGGIRVLRPLLSCSKAFLRAYLAGLGVGYVEDISNFNDKYARTVYRDILCDMERRCPDGELISRRFATAASHMMRAMEALDFYTERAVEKYVIRQSDRETLIDCRFADELPDEIAMRLMSRLISRLFGIVDDESSVDVAAVDKLSHVDAERILHAIKMNSITRADNWIVCGCYVYVEKGVLHIVRQL